MTVGSGSAYSGSGASSGSKLANAFIQLKEEREHTSTELADILTDRFKEIKTSDVRVTQLAGGPPVGTPIVINFKGDDLNVLEQLAIDAARILRTIEGTNAVTTSTKNDNTEFVLEVDKAKATALGLDPFTIAQTLRTAIEGSEATTINTPEQDVKVMVKLNLNPDYLDPHRTNEIVPDAIRNVQIQTPTGTVLLGSIIEITVRKGSTAIRHDDESRVATTESELAEGGNVALILQEFQ